MKNFEAPKLGKVGLVVYQKIESMKTYLHSRFLRGDAIRKANPRFLFASVWQAFVGRTIKSVIPASIVWSRRDCLIIFVCPLQKKENRLFSRQQRSDKLTALKATRLTGLFDFVNLTDHHHVSYSFNLITNLPSFPHTIVRQISEIRLPIST